MSLHQWFSSRWGRRLAAAVTALAVLGVGVTPSQAATVTPQILAKSAGDVPNPMRGQYRWLGAEPSPAGWVAQDTYYRDQVFWSRIEPQPGVYDFTWFDRGIAEANARKGKFGFRVVIYCPGCWMNSTPSWIPKQPGTDVPNWNSATLLSAWERLMKTLGARYGNKVQLGWVDVGGYGAWGEWHNYAGAKEITDANAKRLINAVVVAFPKKYLIMNAMTVRFVDIALGLTPRMGLRVDCLGAHKMHSMLPDTTRWQSRWKTAPVFSEWCGQWDTDFVLGASQVKTWHISSVSSANFKVPYTQMTSTQRSGFLDAARSAGYRYAVKSVTLPSSVKAGAKFTGSMTTVNHGSAPTYDRWSVRLILRDRTTLAAKGTMTLPINLRTHLPGTRTWSLAPTMPSIAKGTYGVYLTVEDAERYMDRMRLANTQRVAGGYLVGTITVA